jgi:hypothetical protein
VLRKSRKQLSRAARELEQQGLLLRQRGKFQPARTPATNLLLRLLPTYPNLIPLLADSGLPVLISLLAPKTVEEIAHQTGFQKNTVYRKLQQARALSIVNKKAKQYSLNLIIWPELVEFLREYKQVQETVLLALPADAFIYSRKRKEVLFSSAQPLEATKTAFSAYEKYGIKLFLPREYYLLPQRKLTLREIFLHSLLITEKEKTMYNLTYAAIFYLRHKAGLRSLSHPILTALKQVLRGKKGRKIPGYPSRLEILARTEVYK